MCFPFHWLSSHCLDSKKLALFKPLYCSLSFHFESNKSFPKLRSKGKHSCLCFLRRVTALALTCKLKPHFEFLAGYGMRKSLCFIPLHFDTQLS